MQGSGYPEGPPGENLHPRTILNLRCPYQNQSHSCASRVRRHDNPPYFSYHGWGKVKCKWSIIKILIRGRQQNQINKEKKYGEFNLAGKWFYAAVILIASRWHWSTAESHACGLTQGCCPQSSIDFIMHSHSVGKPQNNIKATILIDKLFLIWCYLILQTDGTINSSFLCPARSLSFLETHRESGWWNKKASASIPLGSFIIQLQRRHPAIWSLYFLSWGGVWWEHEPISWLIPRSVEGKEKAPLSLMSNSVCTTKEDCLQFASQLWTIEFTFAPT